MKQALRIIFPILDTSYYKYVPKGHQRLIWAVVYLGMPVIGWLTGLNEIWWAYLLGCLFVGVVAVLLLTYLDAANTPTDDHGVIEMFPTGLSAAGDCLKCEHTFADHRIYALSIESNGGTCVCPVCPCFSIWTNGSESGSCGVCGQEHLTTACPHLDEAQPKGPA